MQRVAELLNRLQCREALVRLWVLAAQPAQLNRWEQIENENSVHDALGHFRGKLDAEVAFDIAELRQRPLTLIRALDDHLAAQRSSGSQKRVGWFSIMEDGRDHWLVPVALQARRAAALARQADNHSRWFHHHAVLPASTAHGQTVTVSASRSRLDDSLHALVQRGDAPLRVWVGHFDDEADVQWTRDLSPVNNWRATEVTPWNNRHASLRAALDKARQAGAHVVVFPEFTVDLAHRDAIIEWLRAQSAGSTVQLVVAGSFHESVAADDGNHAAYNTAPVLDCQGRELWSHRKLRLFGSAASGTEHAEVGNNLHVLVTPIGCMTVLICKDFLDVHERVSDLLKEVPVDWVWVPSFGDDSTLRAHQARAKHLARTTPGTTSVVAQTQNTAMAEPGQTLTPLPGFGHAAGQDDPTPSVDAQGGVLLFPLEPQAPPEKRPRLTRIK
jgi:predicted amidohydrolase